MCGFSSYLLNSPVNCSEYRKCGRHPCQEYKIQVPPVPSLCMPVTWDSHTGAPEMLVEEVDEKCDGIHGSRDPRLGSSPGHFRKFCTCV